MEKLKRIESILTACQAAMESSTKEDIVREMDVAKEICRELMESKNLSDINVELTEELPDGSARFNVSASKETMCQLFESFFANAVTRGIKDCVDDVNAFCALSAARDLEQVLVQFDESLNSPIREMRQRLSVALRAFWGV